MIVALPPQSSVGLAKPMAYMPTSIISSQQVSGQAVHVLQQAPAVTMVRMLTPASSNGYVLANTGLAAVGDNSDEHRGTLWHICKSVFTFNAKHQEGLIGSDPSRSSPVISNVV